MALFLACGRAWALQGSELAEQGLYKKADKQKGGLGLLQFKHICGILFNYISYREILLQFSLVAAWNELYVLQCPLAHYSLRIAQGLKIWNAMCMESSCARSHQNASSIKLSSFSAMFANLWLSFHNLSKIGWPLGRQLHRTW